MKISDVTADVADTIVTSPVDVSTAEDKGITDTSVDSQHETDVGGVTDAGMNGAGDGVSLKVMQKYTHLFQLFTVDTIKSCMRGLHQLLSHYLSPTIC